MEINERVGAVASRIGNKAVIFGYGIYEGNKIPDTDDVTFFGQSLKQIGLSNPCILLDSGERVYGCECWWGAEDKVKENLKDCEIEIITPSQYRNSTPVSG